MLELEELRRRLESEPDVDFALLFGSRDPGRKGARPRPDSDWDVAVAFSQTLGADARFGARLLLTARLAEAVPQGRVDVVDLSEAPPLLAHRALMGTKLLVRNRTAFVRFFVRAVGESCDEAPWRELHRRARERRLEEGRFGRP